MRAIVLVLLPALAALGEEFPFQVGEKLSYQIYWGPFVAGDASLEVAAQETVEGRDCYHLICRARTTGLIDLLFHVDNTLESWLDIRELRTLRSRQHRVEGKQTRRSESRYDYANRCYSITNFLDGAYRSFPLEEPLHDLLSAVYYVRTQPLRLHQPLTLTVNAGDCNRQVRIVPDERRTIATRPLGRVPALRVEPNPTLSVVAAHKGRMWIWVSDDAQKLPLVVISQLAIGCARFQLSEIQTADPVLTQRLRVVSSD